MPKILVLGAGASHGHGVGYSLRPPLAGDFFTNPSFSSLLCKYQVLVNYIEKNLGVDLGSHKESEIENLFSVLESTWQLGIYDDPRSAAKRFGEPFLMMTPLEMLRSFVMDAIFLSTRWLSKKSCPYHDYLASNWLLPGDSVISFNCDLIMDFSLARLDHWYPTTGYGFSAWIEGADEERGHSKITMFKLHGSLNWFRSPELHDEREKSQERIWVHSLRNTIEVKELFVLAEFNRCPPRIGPTYAKWGRYWDKQFRDSKVDTTFTEYLLKTNKTYGGLYRSGILPLLIMPTRHKPFGEMIYGQLKNVWQKTAAALELSDEVLACGFSFRDDHFNQLVIESSLVRKEPLRLSICTKDQQMIERIRETFKNANVRVEHFNGHLAELVAYLGYKT